MTSIPRSLNRTDFSRRLDDIITDLKSFDECNPNWRRPDRYPNEPIMSMSRNYVLNDKLKTVSTRGLYWFFLKIVSPFARIFGMDVFAQFRAHRVITVLKDYIGNNRNQVFSDLNHVYDSITYDSSTQHDFTLNKIKRIVYDFNHRTHRKFEASLNEIINPLNTELEALQHAEIER